MFNMVLDIGKHSDMSRVIRLINLNIYLLEYSTCSITVFTSCARNGVDLNYNGNMLCSASLYQYQ
jgi:hypothetical protein